MQEKQFLFKCQNVLSEELLNETKAAFACRRFYVYTTGAHPGVHKWRSQIGTDIKSVAETRNINRSLRANNIYIFRK